MEVGSVVEEVVVGSVVEVGSDVAVAVSVGSDVAVAVAEEDDEVLLSVADELEDELVSWVVWPVLVGAVVEWLEWVVEPWLVPLSSPLQAARVRAAKAVRVE